MFLLSVIPLIDATRFRDTPMRKDISKISNFFLTILQQEQKVYGRILTYSDCMEIAGHSENMCWTSHYDGGEAKYVTDCYWDGACYCTAYMNDEPLYNIKCAGIKEWMIGMGYEWCIYGSERCVGTDYYFCRGIGYRNMGKVEGKCGYEKVCEDGDMKCGDEIIASTPPSGGGTYKYNHRYYCIESSGESLWYEAYLKAGYCGVECLDYTDCGYAELCEDYLCKSYVTCTTGERECVEDNVVICSNNKWSVEKTCPILCSDGKCVTQPTQPEVSSFVKFFQNIWNWIKGLFGG